MRGNFSRSAYLLAFALACLTLSGGNARSANEPSGRRNAPAYEFHVRRVTNAGSQPYDGRLFVILSRTNFLEPRQLLGSAGADAPAWARDVKGFGPGRTEIVARTDFSFPHTNGAVPAGDYFVQALFAHNRDLRFVNAPGNLFSTPQRIRLGPGTGAVELSLSESIPPDALPPDREGVKFIRLQSKLLSEFHHRPIFLRVGVVLPRDYEPSSARRYPLWVQIGGLNTRYAVVNRLMAEGSSFRKVWLAEKTPRFVFLQLDGAGPYGDPYYVNSANNGPYGDALVQELIPEVEARFHCLGLPGTRVLSGSSTGGWVSLALQIFYPEFFGGTWSSCPDPVDFRALQLLDIYKDKNAYVTATGAERPSTRNREGKVVLTMRQEVGAENLLGKGNSYIFSGEQWGAWNAVFSPRGNDGFPRPLWNPQTGAIDPVCAEYWKQYDLRLVLERNWKQLAPKLKGKLHIAAGEADEYYLNNAVHLLQTALANIDPPFDVTIVYGPGKPHGWMDLTLGEMLTEMEAATKRNASP